MTPNALLNVVVLEKIDIELSDMSEDLSLLEKIDRRIGLLKIRGHP